MEIRGRLFTHWAGERNEGLQGFMKLKQKETEIRGEANRDLCELDNGADVMLKVNREAFWNVI